MDEQALTHEGCGGPLGVFCEPTFLSDPPEVVCGDCNAIGRLPQMAAEL